MGETTIEWTDKTWNPVTGCTKVSPGCKHCYAERVFPRAYSKTRIPTGNGGVRNREFTDILVHADRLDQPLRWRKPQRIFTNSMSDLFHEDVPEEFIEEVFAIMARAQQHTFQILTKRPARMLNWFMKVSLVGASDDLWALANGHWPLPNVWLGVSVENQATLHRIDTLKDIPAAVRFVSFEPLLEDLGALILNRIHWAIIGGESGPGARPLNVDWVRSILKQCREQQVAPFVKQLGALPIIASGRQNHWDWGPAIGQEAHFENFSASPAMWRIKLQDRKGGDMSEWRRDLRVREFPHAVPV